MLFICMIMVALISSCGTIKDLAPDSFAGLELVIPTAGCTFAFDDNGNVTAYSTISGQTITGTSSGSYWKEDFMTAHFSITVYYTDDFWGPGCSTEYDVALDFLDNESGYASGYFNDSNIGFVDWTYVDFYLIENTRDPNYKYSTGDEYSSVTAPSIANKTIIIDDNFEKIYFDSNSSISKVEPKDYRTNPAKKISGSYTKSGGNKANLVYSYFQKLGISDCEYRRDLTLSFTSSTAGTYSGKFYLVGTTPYTITGTFKVN